MYQSCGKHVDLDTGTTEKAIYCVCFNSSCAIDNFNIIYITTNLHVIQSISSVCCTSVLLD